MSDMEALTQQNKNTGNNNPPLFTLSDDPHQAINEMMQTIDDLREIYTEENEALRSSDTKKFVALQKRKIEAAFQYRAGSQQIIKRRDEFQKVDPALRKKLVEKQQEFSALANANIEALNRMRHTLDLLNERILHVARKAVVKKDINYSQKGKTSDGKECLSLGLNESV